MENVVLVDDEGRTVGVLRFCRFCKTYTRADSPGWVRPCQCDALFHQRCVNEWSWICEARWHPSYPSHPCCPWCRALYRLEQPPGLFVTALNTLARRYYPRFCDCVAYLAWQVTVDVSNATFGFLILSRVQGSDEAAALLLDADNPMRLVTLCQALAMTALLVNYIPWEDYLLKYLRKCSKLPVLGLVLPSGGPERRVRSHSLPTLGFLGGGCLLVVMAELSGHLLFRSQEPLKRFLLGGTTLLLTRGLFYMYYQQKLYVRRHTLTVEDYVPEDTPTTTSQE